MGTRKKSAAPAQKPPLFKVTTGDGHSPYITAYRWSLPTQRGDGTWEPGAWHEEPPSVLDRGHGLHVTPAPRTYWPSRDCRAWHCEAEGHREDPATSHHVVALRVRLLRPATEQEVEAADRAWHAAWYARQRAEDNRKRLDRARRTAAVRAAGKAEARKKGVPSPARSAFDMLVGMTPTRSWRDVNRARSDALSYAVCYLEFDPCDVAEIHEAYRGDKWMGDREELYKGAIMAGNPSAVVSVERFLGRRPWWHEKRGGGRERMVLHYEFCWQGRSVSITSFDDAADALVACSYQESESAHGPRKIKKRFTITHAEYDAHFRAKSEREAA